MTIVRLCKHPGCRIRLSSYNPTPECWEHRRRPRRIEEELAGKHIMRDDDWLFHSRMLGLHPDGRVETWKAHMMSDNFLGKLTEKMTPSEKRAYRSGEWLEG